MAIQAIAFWILSIVSTLSALAVVTQRNPVHSVLFLILSFFTAAGLFVLLGAEFLAMLLIVVYVGAVAVLFLFVVMMLDIKQEVVREGFIRYLPVGILVALVMLVEMLAMIGVKAMHAHTLGPNPAGESNVAWLGQALYTQFLLPFEIAALILTVGVVAAVALTLRQRLGVRHQSASTQVQVKATDRVRVVKMAPTDMASVLPPPPPPAADPTQENAK